MSLNEKMTGLMNTIRTMSGTTDKLSVDDAARITSSAGQWGVRVPNLMPENLQGGSAKILASHKLVDLTTISNVCEQQTYSVSSYVENAPEDVHIRLCVWDKNWEYAVSNDSATLTKGDSGELKVQVTTPKGMQSPGFFRLSFMVGQNVESDTVINYKNLMLNGGDYAPYTSSTTPYTVDELASSLNNFFLTKLPVMNDGKGHLSTPHGAAQRFNNQGGLTGELVHPNGTNIVVNALKGDVVTQSFVIKTDANFKNVTFNFQTSDGDQAITAGVKQLAQNIYKLYASYTVIKDTPLKLMLFWADCKGGTYVEVSQPYASII